MIHKAAGTLALSTALNLPQQIATHQSGSEFKIKCRPTNARSITKKSFPRVLTPQIPRPTVIVDSSSRHVNSKTNLDAETSPLKLSARRTLATGTARGRLTACSNKSTECSNKAHLASSPDCTHSFDSIFESLFVSPPTRFAFIHSNLDNLRFRF